MTLFNWDESLSVGIPSIDMQHKKLIELVNSFHDTSPDQLSEDKIPELIRSLKEYTVFHFSTEEKYMKQYGFPDYESHRAEHDKFVGKVLIFEKKLLGGNIRVTSEISHFINDWISNHIRYTDHKYSDFLIQRGVK